MRNKTGLHINLDLLAHNFSLLKSICPKNEIIFMVKADGYGHGMVPIVRFATTELPIKEFGCATIGEAVNLRTKLNDLQFEIYVFSDLQLDLQLHQEDYLNLRIIPVISNFADLEIILSNNDFKHFPLCLKFNTGMNRLGFEENSVPVVISKLKAANRKNIFHLMSHFGSAFSLSENSQVINKKQLETFKKIKKEFQNGGIGLERSSISNSAAIEQGFGLEETHIRPGLMLFGPSSIREIPGQPSSWKGKVISRLETYVIKAFPVKKDEAIGYGASPAPDDGVIAIIALGYGDGFSARSASPEIPFNGIKGRILGRVNMDMFQIFYPKEAIGLIKSGSNFQIWGHKPSDLMNFSYQTKTTPYEHFCQLTCRVPRIYSLK